MKKFEEWVQENHPESDLFTEKKGKGAVKGKRKKMGAGQGKQRRLQATKYE